MDRAPVMGYIRQMDSRRTADLLEETIGFLTDEQFKECLRRAFAKNCPGENDVENAIRRVIENVSFDVESSYYDDDDEVSQDDIADRLRDRFGFVKAMFDAELGEDADEYCRRIADGLDRVSLDERYAKIKDLLVSQRDDMLRNLGDGQSNRWFVSRKVRDRYR
jgi:hypothetical protein